MCKSNVHNQVCSDKALPSADTYLFHPNSGLIDAHLYEQVNLDHVGVSTCFGFIIILVLLIRVTACYILEDPVAAAAVVVVGTQVA